MPTENSVVVDRPLHPAEAVLQRLELRAGLVGDDVLPDVGMMYRSEQEQELIAKAAKAIGTQPA